MSLFLFAFFSFAVCAATWLAAASFVAHKRAATAKRIETPPRAFSAINGASGIAITQREIEYAAELWLEGPSAFWLHPEGPLSDTTPEEWQERRRSKTDPVAAGIVRAAHQRGLDAGRQLAAYQNIALQSAYLQQSYPPRGLFYQHGLSNSLGPSALFLLRGY